MNVSVSLLAVTLTSIAVTPLRVLDDVSLEFRLRSEDSGVGVGRRPAPPPPRPSTESVERDPNEDPNEEADVDLRLGGARTGMTTPCALRPARENVGIAAWVSQFSSGLREVEGGRRPAMDRRALARGSA